MKVVTVAKRGIQQHIMASVNNMGRDREGVGAAQCETCYKKYICENGKQREESWVVKDRGSVDSGKRGERD